MTSRIFKPGPACSLRHALLWWLLPVYLSVAVGAAAVSWWSYTLTVRTFMDNQMSLLADSLSGHEGSAPLERLDSERVHKWGSFIVQVWSRDGELLRTSWPGASIPLQDEPGLHDVRTPDWRWHVYTAPQAGPDGSRVQIAQCGVFRAKLVAGRAAAAIAPILLLLLVSLAVLWAMVGKVTEGVREVAAEVAAQDEQSGSGLAEDRVPLEMRPLVAAFNGLVARMRGAYSARRQFVQDAAHELRTPIAAIGLQLENLRGDVCQGQTAQRFSQLEAGVQRAQRLVDQLLKLSRHEDATAAQGTPRAEVRQVLGESIQTLLALADQRGIDLGFVDDTRDALACPGSTGDLRSAVDSLVENALRYTPAGGTVDVRLAERHGAPIIEVIDSGPGIPDELLERVFDRFFRLPGAPPGGSGLGLAIARAAARRCGLDVSLRNRADRSGLIARIGPALRSAPSDPGSAIAPAEASPVQPARSAPA